MKRLMVGLLLLAATSPLLAGESESVTLTFHRDVDVTAVEYCSATGLQGVWGTSGHRGVGKIESAGSSTTWSSTDASLNAFTDGTGALLAAGDYIVAIPPGSDPDLTAVIAVVASVSADSITVGTAANISGGTGYTWEWFDVTCGTTTTSGIYDVAGYDAVLFTYDVNQLSVTGGIDLRPECKVDAKGSDWVVVTDDGAEDAVTAVGTGSYAIVLSEAGFGYCRFGAYIDSGDDGSDTGADLEQFTVTITRWKQ